MRSKGWQKQEDRVAKELDGQVSAGSGAFDRKGDVRAGEWLVEAKWTGKKSMSVKAEVLEKINREAILEGRRPLLHIELNGRNYALIEWGDFLELTGQE